MNQDYSLGDAQINPDHGLFLQKNHIFQVTGEQLK